MGARLTPQIKAIRPPCPKCGTPVKRAAAIHCSRECAGNTKHNLHGSPEYSAWKDMRHRCNMPTHQAYPRYGGRGITVCERWQDSFSDFLADMGPKPEKSYSIERINNDGNYEPSNCKWATKKEQGANRSVCWKADDDAALRKAIEGGANYGQAARAIGKDPGCTAARAKRLGLASNWNPHALRGPKRRSQSECQP